MPDIKRLGFKSIINLRESQDHLPFNIASPDPRLVDNFIAAVTTPANQPAFIHCALGGRAASLWMIKRVEVDGWDQQKALTEAEALGLTDRLRPFVTNYLQTHKK